MKDDGERTEYGGFANAWLDPCYHSVCTQYNETKWLLSVGLIPRLSCTHWTHTQTDSVCVWEQDYILLFDNKSDVKKHLI